MPKFTRCNSDYFSAFTYRYDDVEGKCFSIYEFSEN